MTLADLGNIGEFVGAIGVVLSLLYLAAQIRQNTRSVRASTHHAATVSGNTVQLAFAEAEVGELVLKAGRAYDDLSLAERFRLTMLLRAFFSFQEDLFLQFREDLLDRDVWESRTRTISETLAEPGLRAWWAKNQHVYSAAFQEEVAKLLAA